MPARRRPLGRWIPAVLAGCWSAQQGAAWAASPARLDAGGHVEVAPTHLAMTDPRTGRREHLTEIRTQARLNLLLDAGPHWRMHAQTRLRHFGGDTVRRLPGYADAVARDDGLADLSWVIHEGDAGVLYAQPDRLYCEWDGGDWNIRLGRQRINWGMALITNPNDIFNHYSFYDFDYPERPGSDAMRIQRHYDFGTRIELAVRPGRTRDETIAALLAALPLLGYDVQAIAGRHRDRWAAGLGLAGDLGGAGLKGEVMTYIHPDPGDEERRARSVMAVSVDYMFANRLFAYVELLYNEGGGQDALHAGPQRIAPDNPSFARQQATVQLSWQAHPLLDAAVAVMAFPEEKGWHAGPSATWSAAPNTDVLLAGQFFGGRAGSRLDEAGRRWILSVKHSF